MENNYLWKELVKTEKNFGVTGIGAAGELYSAAHPLKESRAALPDNDTALEEHLQCRLKMMEYDKNALGIMKRGLDVPFSHIQEKSHQDTG